MEEVGGTNYFSLDEAVAAWENRKQLKLQASDCTIVSLNGEIDVHTDVLCDLSKYLNTLIESEKNALTNTSVSSGALKITFEVPKESLEKLLYFAYAGRFKESGEGNEYANGLKQTLTDTDLFYALGYGHVLEVETLIEEAQTCLIRKASAVNILKVYESITMIEKTAGAKETKRDLFMKKVMATKFLQPQGQEEYQFNLDTYMRFLEGEEIQIASYQNSSQNTCGEEKRGIGILIINSVREHFG